MAKKYINWKTKGMNRDMSVSAFNPEFAFENVNLRLATNEGNTMMSWVNERGTKVITIAHITQGWDDVEIENKNILGTPIGTAVLNHQLIIFTTSNGTKTTEKKPDRIYVFKYSDTKKDTMVGILLYEGNLNFHVECPLETLVAYEADYIQKVYWTDNRNQPRLINIASSSKIIKKWNATPLVQNFFFDFVPSFQIKESDVNIKLNLSSGGLFAPGVIQYVFTYINKYGQESNIAYFSTLYYLSHSDRGASPEDKVTSSFRIEINNPDSNFDYVKIYSIQRTSINSEPIVKELDSIPIEDSASLTYIDNGTFGSTIDPTQLLYIGGKEIKALTMASKDNTLFLGNITQMNSLVSSIQDYYDFLRKTDDDDPMGIIFKNDGNAKKLVLDHTTGIYSHTNMLKYNLREISTFKGNETYRFGFQLQKKTGEWSEPIFMNDVTNPKYPMTEVNNDIIKLVYAEADINLVAVSYAYNSKKKSTEEDFFSVYKGIRPVIVYPTIGDRNVLCQGVVNPTVFNAKDRLDSSPFSQASWFFRPYIVNSSESTSDSMTYEDLKINVDSGVPAIDPDQLIANSIDSFLKENGLLQDMYVLVADVDVNYIDDILSSGQLWYHRNKDERFLPEYADRDDRELEYDNSDYPEPFSGVIRLENNPSSSAKTIRYAFLSKYRFTEEKNEDFGNEPGAQTYGHEEIYYTKGVGVVRLENKTFKFYKDMKLTSNHLYYYEKRNDTSAPNPYEFMFYTAGELYTITFTSVGSNSSYGINTGENSGDIVRFNHYDSLYTLDDFTKKTNYNDPEPDHREEARQLEIEGAIKTYASPYSKTKLATKESNTQFFVDQSIVTLNSPDIEFDTEVQSYGVEGLKLRIVGAIPITANASAHSFTLSSSMLETNHNSGNSNLGAYFGIGERDYNVIHNNISTHGGKRLVSEYLWNDVVVKQDLGQTDGVQTGERYNFLVYPWQRTGSMNNDIRVKESSDNSGNKVYASSYLQTKKESHILFSINSSYFKSHELSTVDFQSIHSKIHLTENDMVKNIRIKQQKDGLSEINYYPNIDKVLTNEEGYKVLVDYNSAISLTSSWSNITNPISMKYKSTSHAVVALSSDSIQSTSKIPILPYASFGNKIVGQFTNPNGNGETFWGDDNVLFSQSSCDLSNVFSGNKYDFLWLAELYKDVDASSRFGGKSRAALLNNQWLVCGEAKPLSAKLNSVTLDWTEGDTFYQRYDCLKTYPFTTEDTNQITEILSFMCETHVNIDGRYDQNRGQLKNYTMRPENFNKLNPVYSQQNNFFSSRKLDTKDISELSYPNHVYYSKTKENGADIDLWTNVTLASTLELDGDKGKITALDRLNDQLVAFQDSGIAQILYNENVQIASTAGVPIEISNSGKVQGKRYLSDTIGCSNKWSIAQTPNGIYFMDSNDKSIYLFNGQLNNLSTAGGFNSWAKQNIPSADTLWTPKDRFDNFVAYYDKLNQDVLFIGKDTALAYSEKFNCFTSFYDYGNAPYFENLDDVGIWIKGNKLWQHQAGEYCNFFGNSKPFSMTLVANQEPQIDKIFTNLEFRACVDGEGTYDTTKDKFVPSLPFDSLEAWDEYQHGIMTLNNRNANDRFTHGKDNGILARKFRMWACDIPRDNARVDATTESPMGIKRFKARLLDRIRNPWAYIKLKKDAATTSFLNKTEIHDIMATYFG